MRLWLWEVGWGTKLHTRPRETLGGVNLTIVFVIAPTAPTTGPTRLSCKAEEAVT